MQIFIDDIRKAGFCVSGARRWFIDHGLPFNNFLREGIDETTFLERGDEMARLVVERKRERENRHG